MGATIETGRFGQLTIGDRDLVTIPQGILGFPDYTKYCLVDPGDETLIMWLQCLEKPELAFPILEPKIFKQDYTVRLSAAELRELRLENIRQAGVVTILTIPEDVTQMSANLKAPLVLNLKTQIAKQVVLQENEYTIKHPMFKELRSHIITMMAQNKAAAVPTAKASKAVLSIDAVPASSYVRSLEA